MSEEFDKWLDSDIEGVVSDPKDILEAAFAAGQAAAIDAMNKLPHRAMFDSDYARGAADEREACAELSELFCLGVDVDDYPVYAKDVAAAIRKRGEVTNEC